MCIVGRFLFFLFFFFKQKTAYEMRISDWSSDVCSSDLIGAARGVHRVAISAVPVGVENQGFTAVASLQRRAAADRNIGSVEVLRLVAIIMRDGRSSEGSSEEHTSEIQALMRISYDLFCQNTNKNHCLAILEPDDYTSF